MRKLLILILLCAPASLATTRYVAQTAGTFSGGTACNTQTAITPATFNGLTLAADDLTWVCGAITGSLNGNVLTFGQSGTSGHPILLQFDTGSSISSPACSGTNGCINVSGRSWITINGENVGVVQNTANGDSLANQQISILINASPCANCIIENFANLANDYVAVKNFATPIGGPATQMNAITISGSNTTISGNVIHDCGWCILAFYGSGDTNYQIFGNTITNWDHGVAFATSGANACTTPCLLFHDNQYGGNINWETSGCVYHLDGIHTFGATGSTMDGIYGYNNYFKGSLSGACSSGFVFMEQGVSTPSHARNVHWGNNVFDASAADGVNPNGWVGLFSGEAGTTEAYDNTLKCPSSTDGGTVGWGIQQQGANIIFEDNVENLCPQGNNLKQGAGTLTMDYNAYGHPCNGTSNCFVFGSSPTFEGSFAAWKTACACDAHSQQTTTDAGMLLNANGSLQTSSPVIQQGVNLTTTATGSLAWLASDTTLGGTRTGTARPTGTCTSQGTATCWDEGAWEFAGIVSLSPVSLAYGTVTKNTSSVGQTTTLTNNSGATITFTGVTFTGTNSTDFTAPVTDTCNSGSLTDGSTCVVTVVFTPTATAGTAETGTLNIAFTGASGSPLTVSLTGTSGATTAPPATGRAIIF